MEERCRRELGFFGGLTFIIVVLAVFLPEGIAAGKVYRNAYASMMYMGTPRDYEFYVATRVMIRSLARLKAEADLVVIASMDVPPRWIEALKKEDGAKVVTVENLNNPYKNQANFNHRFKLTLNKLYAWSLIDYDRVVMLDSDNLFLHNTDELFQCGQFCAVFINPCIFHTGLFVLQMVVILNIKPQILFNAVFMAAACLISEILLYTDWLPNLINNIHRMVVLLNIKPQILFNAVFMAAACLISEILLYTDWLLNLFNNIHRVPSMAVFKDMLHELEVGRKNSDGADQGFLGSYFFDLLDRPMFHPPLNGTKLSGNYRLPLGYQMDASYYYLKLRWSIPCGPNSVITFPSAPWLKPWYWWSWPVLPLGLSWHEQRHQTLGYGADVPVVLIQSVMYLLIMTITRLARPNFSKLCYRRPDKSITCYQTVLKATAMWSILAAYLLPCLLIPRTVHPLLGWSLYLLGSSSLASVAINAFLLPALPVLTPWLGIAGALGVMAFPWYSNGVVRALVVSGYAFFCAPFVWCALVKVMSCLQVSLEREAFFPRMGESPLPEFTKLY